MEDIKPKIAFKGTVYIKTELKNVRILMIITAVLPLLTLLIIFCIPLPEGEQGDKSFQRIGSLMVAFFIFIQAKLSLIKEPLTTRLFPDEELQEKYGPTFIKYLNLSYYLLFLSTIIWGYGDIIYNYF